MGPLIRGTALLNFQALVSSLGGDGKALLRARGIDPAAAGDYDAFLSSAAAAAVVADAAEAMNCSDFGMRLAREQGVQILGPVAVIIRNAETVGSAIDGVSRFLHNIAPTDHVELIRGSEQAVFTLTTSVRQLARHDQWVEKGLGISLDAFRLMLGVDFVPVRVTMQHRRISPNSSYWEMFGCPVEFEAELNSVHLPHRVVNQTILGRDAAALALAERYLAGIGPDQEAADHVRDLTRRLLVVNQASLAAAARAMALHPRVLQRRLADSGTTFEEILDDVRKELAWQLSATGMQVSQIASALGYSEQSSYTRACRRWYDESPRQLRARRRGQGTSDER
ncbi:AraC family transcriptional regulator [Nocardioides sp. WS12]|uniref:AraC family transcriptional regulator n=1 Tax=Nocardioides sp. WS12 TaxID=2486272 RepID=UPI0015F9C83D|nr:AraC family transcriptional regulator [Nocardioides sp. WS12]